MSSTLPWLAVPLLFAVPPASAEERAAGSGERIRPYAVTEARQPCEAYRLA